MTKLSPWALSALLFTACGGEDDPPVTPPSDACTAIEGTVSAGGLDIRRPTRPANGCREVPKPGATMGEMMCQETAPDFSCVGQTQAASTPVNVTFRGCVTTFGIGATSYGLTVTVFKERTAAGMPVDPGYDVNGMPGMQAEKDMASFIGKTVSTEVPIGECPDQGFFSIPNVPTETPLIVRVTQQQVEKGVRTYVDTYQYGTVLRNSSVVTTGGVAVPDPATACLAAPCFAEDQVNTIQSATYQTISRAAGVTSVQGERDLYDGMGQGHVAGEVQDCTSANKVQNAVVTIDAMARKLSYFNVGYNDEGSLLEDPKPSSTRTMTNADGLYLALAVDTQPGGREISIGAAVTPSVCGADGVCQCTDDGKKNPAWTAADQGEAETVVLGTRRIYVFPDSVTIMTFDRVLYESPR